MYPDGGKTDLNELRKQSNEKNNDAIKIMELIDEVDSEINDDSPINIPVELKHLHIKKYIYWFQSEYDFYEKNKKEIKKNNYSKKDCVHPSLYAFYDIINF